MISTEVLHFRNNVLSKRQSQTSSVRSFQLFNDNTFIITFSSLCGTFRNWVN